MVVKGELAPFPASLRGRSAGSGRRPPDLPVRVELAGGVNVWHNACVALERILIE
jgi:hypothetical protein